MALSITIDYLDRPSNVVATLQSGGSLLANTTYYVVIVAKSFSNSTRIQLGTKISRPSTEISFTTTTTELSVKLDWDVLSGAVSYDVYLSKSSGDYSNTGYNAGCRQDLSSTQNYGVLTNTATVTFDNYGGTRSGATSYIGYPRNGYNNSYRYLPTHIDTVDLGWVRVLINSDNTTNVTFEDIKSAVVAAGFSDHVFWEEGGIMFSLIGNIEVANGATGALTNKYNTDYIIGDMILFLTGAIRNYSDTFTVSLGAKLPSGIPSNMCVYITGEYYNYVTNIKMYGAVYNYRFHNPFYPVVYGSEIKDIHSDIQGVIFYNTRNSGTNFSNNYIHAASAFRTWGNITVTDSKWDSSSILSQYPRNGAFTVRDTSMRFNSTIVFCTITGYTGHNYPDINWYDISFHGDDNPYKSYDDIIVKWSAYDTLGAFNLHYSMNLTVKDEDGVAISGASVNVYDKDDNVLFDETSNVDGTVDKMDVLVLKLEATGNGTGDAYTRKTSYSPYKIVISKSGYQDLTLDNIVLSGKVTWEMVLLNSVLNVLNDGLSISVSDDSLSISL